jgi:peptidoglycan/LPS O-acetylase OafA/YrhL
LFFELIVNAGFAWLFAASKTRWLPTIVAVSGTAVAFLMAFDLFETQILGGCRAIYGFSLGVLLYRGRWRPFRFPTWFAIGVVGATFALPHSKLVELACVFFIHPFAVSTLAFGSASISSRFLKILGDLSFPLYALHYPILQAALGLRDHLV